MKKFYAIIGNPPYQEETTQKEPTSNGQKPVKSIFNDFQDEADKIAYGSVELVYPGGRWIHQSGKGMQEFGHRQINDNRLSHVVFYKRSEDLFDNVGIADGVSIVLKKMNKTTPGFRYTYVEDGQSVEAHVNNPGDNLIPLNPLDSIIVDKIDRGVSRLGIKYLHDAILPRSLFGIESNYVEKNPNIVRPFNESPSFDPKTEVKLFTNDKAGKSGRAKWFIAPLSAVPKGQQFIHQWQVVVSSANAGGQKRDNQIAIIDNHSAFGRARVALRSFERERESKNFFSYCNTYLVRFAFLMTDEALSTLGKRVPDFGDYSDRCPLNFDNNLDTQLFKLFEFNDDDIKYVTQRVDSLRNNSVSATKEMD